MDETYGSDVRLIPNDLFPKSSGKVGFTGIFSTPVEDADPVAKGDVGDWYLPCATWFGVSELAWGDVGLEQFVFERDGDGRVGSVVSKGLRVRMERVE